AGVLDTGSRRRHHCTAMQRCHGRPKSSSRFDALVTTMPPRLPPAGAILGFANMLLRLYRGEQPRAVLVAWDMLEIPTYRHEKFPAYQSRREFDNALLEQLHVLPE